MHLTLVKKPNVNDAPSNLAIVERFILTHDIFEDWTNGTGVDIEIKMTDSLSKLEMVYGVLFEGKTYNIATRFDWLGRPSHSALRIPQPMN